MEAVVIAYKFLRSDGTGVFTKVVAPHGRLLRRIDAWDNAFRAAYT